jgi:hypothetical protein
LFTLSRTRAFSSAAVDGSVADDLVSDVHALVDGIVDWLLHRRRLPPRR